MLRLLFLFLLACSPDNTECQKAYETCDFGISAWECPTGLQLQGHGTVIEVDYDQTNPTANFAIGYWLTMICE